jgi:hypothetical protein
MDRIKIKKRKTHVGKGSSFERLVGEKLSLWLSRGERKDYFARNVLSGGQFTSALKRSQLNHGQGGDLIAIHPDASWFTQTYHIECKHVKSLELHTVLFLSRFPGSFLKAVIAKAKQQAELEGKRWLVIARQNAFPIVVISGQWMGAHHQQALKVNGYVVYLYLFDELFCEPDESIEAKNERPVINRPTPHR